MAGHKNIILLTLKELHFPKVMLQRPLRSIEVRDSLDHAIMLFKMREKYNFYKKSQVENKTVVSILV